MKLEIQLRWCILLSVLLTLLLVGLTIGFASSDGWVAFGPSATLFVAGVAIDTTGKYVLLVLLISVNSIIDMLINEFASPILGFNIYNPDKKVITDFRSKTQLQTLAAMFWASNNMRAIFTVLITVAQIDLALIKWGVMECTAIYTINKILSGKKFESYEPLN